MIGRLAFYALEAALLAGLVGASLWLADRGLRRMGAPVGVRLRRLIPWLWLGFAAIGVAFGETLGPEFVLPYSFCFWLAVGSGALWLVSFARRGALAGGRGQSTEPASERKPG